MRYSFKGLVETSLLIFNNSLAPPDVDHRCPILSKEADI